MTESTTASVLILIGIIVGTILVSGALMVYLMVYMMRKTFKQFGDGVKEIGDNLERIGEKVEVIGKFLTGLTIGLLKASKEQRPLTGDDLREGLKIVEESKTTEELLEKLSREQLPEGRQEESKEQK